MSTQYLKGAQEADSGCGNLGALQNFANCGLGAKDHGVTRSFSGALWAHIGTFVIGSGFETTIRVGAAAGA
jgi:hypothetical protein